MQTISFLSADLHLAETMAKKWNLDLSASRDQKKIAEAILELSDFFIQNSTGKTPWENPRTQWAYTFYFSPLNATRMQRVLTINQGRLRDLKIHSITDFGAGLASGGRTLKAHFPQAELHLVDRSEQPLQILKSTGQELHSFNKELKVPTTSNKAVVCSYSLTELQQLPTWIKDFDHVFILEPATQEDGRRLQEWRTPLLQQGFHVLAPCTHKKPCPLLTHSKTDWCHDRFQLEAPDWFRGIEQHLPMKNNTLTVSYLILSRQEPKAWPQGTARIVGDLLKEKGKDRQLICRGEQREFLAWMHKHGEHETLYRGETYIVPPTVQVVSNELRLKN